MLASSGFAFVHLRYILSIPLKYSVILLKSPTSTGNFSNSTGSPVTKRQFSPSSGWYVCMYLCMCRYPGGRVSSFHMSLNACLLPQLSLMLQRLNSKHDKTVATRPTLRYTVQAATTQFGQTNPYTCSLLDAWTLAFKEPLYNVHVGLPQPPPLLESESQAETTREETCMNGNELDE